MAAVLALQSRFSRSSNLERSAASSARDSAVEETRIKREKRLTLTDAQKKKAKRFPFISALLTSLLFLALLQFAHLFLQTLLHALFVRRLAFLKDFVLRSHACLNLLDAAGLRGGRRLSARARRRLSSRCLHALTHGAATGGVPIAAREKERETGGAEWAAKSPHFAANEETLRGLRHLTQPLASDCKPHRRAAGGLSLAIHFRGAKERCQEEAASAPEAASGWRLAVLTILDGEDKTLRAASALRPNPEDTLSRARQCRRRVTTCTRRAELREAKGERGTDNGRLPELRCRCRQLSRQPVATNLFRVF